MVIPRFPFYYPDFTRRFQPFFYDCDIIILTLGDVIMRMERRFVFQVFMASILVFLLAFSMLTPSAQPIIIHRSFDKVHSDHPLMNRVLN